MKLPKITIAIDGYSSTGKSSFAKLLAKELGLLYLDSGALYRGVTLFAQEAGYIDAGNHISEALKEKLASLELKFFQGKLYMGERCVEEQIRSMKVSSQVSPIAAVAYVRHFVDERLHAMAAEESVIMDGRDIGTTVFPNAQVKIFMTASEEVRVRRRYDELLAKGSNPDFEEVRENLRQRDYIDSHRETSPLSQASDAFVLDNSEMTLKEEVEWAKGLIRGKLGIYEEC